MTQDLKDHVLLDKSSFNRLLHLARQDKMWPTKNEIADIAEKALAQDLSGMQLAPLEPTYEMCLKGDRHMAVDDFGYVIGDAQSVWHEAQMRAEILVTGEK